MRHVGRFWHHKYLWLRSMELLCPQHSQLCTVRHNMKHYGNNRNNCHVLQYQYDIVLGQIFWIDRHDDMMRHEICLVWRSTVWEEINMVKQRGQVTSFTSTWYGSYAVWIKGAQKAKQALYLYKCIHQSVTKCWAIMLWYQELAVDKLLSLITSILWYI